MGVVIEMNSLLPHQGPKTIDTHLSSFFLCFLLVAVKLNDVAETNIKPCIGIK